jgi:hypothetical protein
LLDFFTFTIFFNGYEVSILLQNFESCELFVWNDEREDVGAMNGRDLQGIETNCSMALWQFVRNLERNLTMNLERMCQKKYMGLMDIKERVYFTTPFFTNYNGSHFYSHFFFEKYVFFIYLHEFSQFLQGSSTIKKLSNSYYFLPN